MTPTSCTPPETALSSTKTTLTHWTYRRLVDTTWTSRRYKTMRWSCWRHQISVLSPYKEAAIGYIAGYVVRVVDRRIQCLVCTSALQAQGSLDETYARKVALITCKNRGGLIRPSPSVIKVCETTEKCFQHMLKTNNGKPPQTSNVIPTLSTVVLHQLAGHLIFESLVDHMFDSTPENNHLIRLIKCVCSCFGKIRMHHVARRYTEQIIGDRVRKQFTKLVLFKHQQQY